MPKHIFKIYGNRNKKFRKWLDKYCNSIEIYECINIVNRRYGKYFDRKRYSDTKIKDVLKQDNFCIVVFTLNEEFELYLKLANVSFYKFIKKIWKTNVKTFMNFAPYKVTNNLFISEMFGIYENITFTPKIFSLVYGRKGE